MLEILILTPFLHVTKCVWGAYSETLTIETEGELCVVIEREGQKTVARPVSKGRGNTRIFSIDAGTVHVAPGMLHEGDIVKVKRFFN